MSSFLDQTLNQQQLYVWVVKFDPYDSLCMYMCLYKEGVADRMLCVSSLKHSLCCHGEIVLCFPIGGEINTIFNWPGGLPLVWEIA